MFVSRLFGPCSIVSIAAMASIYASGTASFKEAENSFETEEHDLAEADTKSITLLPY